MNFSLTALFTLFFGWTNFRKKTAMPSAVLEAQQRFAKGASVTNTPGLRVGSRNRRSVWKSKNPRAALIAARRKRSCQRMSFGSRHRAHARPAY